HSWYRAGRVRHADRLPVRAALPATPGAVRSCTAATSHHRCRPPGCLSIRMNDLLIEAREVRKHFPIRRATFATSAVVRAVDGVDLGIRKGETVGLVGESGCGKSTLGRLFLRLIEPTSGAILHKGDDLTTLPRGVLRARRRNLQIIFQDPFGSL